MWRNKERVIGSAASKNRLPTDVGADFRNFYAISTLFSCNPAIIQKLFVFLHTEKV